MPITSLTGVVIFLFGLGLGLTTYVKRRRQRSRRDKQAYESAILKQLHIPNTLHPVIDPNLCIGSLSCLTACPEGDILGIIDGKAVLINAANCIGHGACAVECPVDAIKLVFGTAERGVDLPQLDENFESSRSGIYVVGELGGMGLIKNAFTQGLQVTRHLKQSLTHKGQNKVDVAIVGAGPAGIATAIGCREHGLSYALLEQSTLGGTVTQYPRQKVVMVDSFQVPFYGKFGRQRVAKEELLFTFQKMMKNIQGKVMENTRVEKVSGADGQFVVHSSRGPLTASKVVLAIGRRGTPRQLEVPGEALSKVTYSLIDPEQYEGKKVLVVGGGDAAIESALMLANTAHVNVAISYRQAEFARCRPDNREAIATAIRQRKVTAYLPSEVVAIEPHQVQLHYHDKTLSVANDFVIINIGGVLPLSFLNDCGVEVTKLFGEARKSKNKRPGRNEVTRILSDELLQERARRRLAWTLTAIGALIITILTAVGWRYYWLPPALRVRSPLHAWLRPGGVWGHGVGIVATLFLLSNFSYAIRKRWRWLKGSKSIRGWLTFHMFVGFMAPLVIVYHAAFQSKNIFATVTFASLLVVVVTGIIGRYIYGLVPVAGSKTLEHAELLSRWQQTVATIRALFPNQMPADIQRFFGAMAASLDQEISIISLLLNRPFDWLRMRRILLKLRWYLRGTAKYRECAPMIRKIMALRNQLRAFKSIKRLLASWRALHVVLAVLLVILITGHIYVSIYMGYRWIFH